MTNKGSFTSSFMIRMPFTSFPCLITLARNSSTKLNKNGEGGHPCLLPYLRRKALRFSPLSMVFMMLTYIYSMSTLLRVFILSE